MPDRAVSLIMPMAGRGSRFARHGEARPKPLIELAGRPFFWWATESLRRSVPVGRMIFVVLQEHCAGFGIDATIRSFYPEAEVIAIADVTAGAAQTAMIGVAALGDTPGPLAINDCDHAFCAPGMAQVLPRLGLEAEGLQAGGTQAEDLQAEGALVSFASDSPAYSYIRLSASGAVAGTVEKQVVSRHAIAGCYGFADARRLAALYDRYRRTCPYSELFVSGVFNEIIATGGHVRQIEAAPHVSFGTPEELARIDPARFCTAFPWI